MTKSKRMGLCLNFALKRHGDVPKSSKFHSLFHPLAVQYILDTRGFHSLKFMMASLLHDTLQERVATYAEIRKLAGKEVAEMIYAITYELGRDRAQSMRRTWGKIARNQDALTLKLADYISNAQYYREHVPRSAENIAHFNMYRKEYPAFRSLMLHRKRDAMLWIELDSSLGAKK